MDVCSAIWKKLCYTCATDVLEICYTCGVLRVMFCKGSIHDDIYCLPLAIPKPMWNMRRLIICARQFIETEPVAAALMGCNSFTANIEDARNLYIHEVERMVILLCCRCYCLDLLWENRIFVAFGTLVNSVYAALHNFFTSVVMEQFYTERDTNRHARSWLSF